MKVFIYSADSKFGALVAKEFLYGKHSASEVVCGVYSIRNEYSMRLLEMGARVVEIDMESASEIGKLMKSADASVIVPAYHYGPNWQRATKSAIDALKQSNQSKATLLSCLSVEVGSGSFVNKLKEIEQAFTDAAGGSNKSFTILRSSVPQQIFLLWSRLIQETGSLMAPIGNGKCAYVDFCDVAHCAAAVLSGRSSSAEKGIQVYKLTGPESIDGEAFVRKLNQNAQVQFKYSDIEPRLAERFLRTELGEQASYEAIEAMMNVFDLIKKNKYEVTTQDVKKLTGQDANPIDNMIKRYADLFRP
jgi:uncharacterized protein YbjT (DUF2867 family)